MAWPRTSRARPAWGVMRRRRPERVRAAEEEAGAVAESEKPIAGEAAIMFILTLFFGTFGFNFR